LRENGVATGQPTPIAARLIENRQAPECAGLRAKIVGHRYRGRFVSERAAADFKIGELG
jgi:hypothetical protein